MKICLVSSEVAPFAKTGGLADVAAALARALDAKGHDVRLFMPMYASLRTSGHAFQPLAGLQDIPMELGTHRHSFSVSTARLPGSDVDVRLVRCPALFDTEALYADDGREHLRFTLLSRAALESCQHTGWAPDIVHCNDWHTGMIPLYLKAFYSWDQLFARTKTVLTIHNIGYQGVFSSETLEDIGVASQRELLYQEDLEEGNVNFLKTGLLYADALTTVSDTYAREIRSPEFGMGLEGLLEARKDALFGIVNGVDYSEWDPSTDELLPARYDVKDLTGKRECRAALLERLALEPDEGSGRSGPLFGIVSRLTYQKGFELLPDVLPLLLRRPGVRLAVLGSGEEKYEQYFSWLADNFPGRVGFHQGYDNQLAHLIEAGSDLFLMPSRYEPCGLNQMYSLKYGTVPVVRRTGGLADTVDDFDRSSGTGNGFLFDGFEPEALLASLESALEVYADEASWNKIVENGMRCDFSWEKQAGRYEELYARLIS